MTIRMDEMSWVEIAEVLEKPNVVVLPVGSTEEHGAHLPVNIDSATTTYIAERAAQKAVAEHKINVLVAPCIHYSEVSLHKRFPGTIGVKADTLIKMLVDINNSFIEQGFKNIVTLTGHHENNAPIEVALAMVTDEHPQANIFGITTMGLGFDARPGLVKAGLAGMGHALEVETSQAMVIQPQNVHLERVIIGSRQLPLSERYIGATGKDKSHGMLFVSGLTGFEKSGTFGDPTRASKEEGEKILNAMISDVADILTQIVKPAK